MDGVIVLMLRRAYEREGGREGGDGRTDDKEKREGVRDKIKTQLTPSSCFVVFFTLSCPVIQHSFLQIYGLVLFQSDIVVIRPILH